MGSKERRLRVKDQNRMSILEAAMRIGKEEGWQAVSMRKIAEVIEFTVPVIYKLFDSKETIMLELTKGGYRMLANDLALARDKHRLPEKQLEEMWLAYWRFAFAEKELYQLMFGIVVNCYVGNQYIAEAEEPANMIKQVIIRLTGQDNPPADLISKRYYSFWSVVHGLISINMVKENVPVGMNDEVLKDAISSIIRAIKQ
jgi:AcrR family transcriptional regulator